MSQRTIILSTLDGIFYCLMVGTGETYLVAFALSNGVSETQSALIGVVPVIIGSFVQLATYRLTAFVGNLKRVVVSLAIIQASCIGLTGLAALPVLQPYCLPILMVLASLYWSASLASGPPWNMWIGDLVPPKEHHRFFFRRNTALQLATIFALVCSGAYLKFGGAAADPGIFARLFVIAAATRLISAYFLGRHPKSNHQIAAPMNFGATKKWLQSRQVRSAILYTLFLNASVYISAPYFVPYMLAELKLDFLAFTWLIASAFAARSLVGPLLRGVVNRHGVQVMFLLGFILIIPVPVLWTMTNNYAWLLLFQIISGIAWGAHEMGLTLFLLESMPPDARSKLLSLCNFTGALGMAIGVFIGVSLIETFNLAATDYHRIFTVSTFARLVPALLIFGFIRSIRQQPVPMRVLGIRPGGFGILRPMLKRRTDDNDPAA